jgi:hypothetical protein
VYRSLDAADQAEVSKAALIILLRHMLVFVFFNAESTMASYMRKDLDACVFNGNNKWRRGGVLGGQIKSWIVVRNEPAYDPST